MNIPKELIAQVAAIDYSELDEVAERIGRAHRQRIWDTGKVVDLQRFVHSQMPNESFNVMDQVIDKIKRMK